MRILPRESLLHARHDDLHQSALGFVPTDINELTFSLKRLAHILLADCQTYVAIKGSSSFTRRLITSGYTTNPDVTLSTVVNYQIMEAGCVLTQEDETCICGEIEFRNTNATDSAVILIIVNQVPSICKENSPKSAQTIAPSTCQEHLWEGFEDVCPESTDAPNASGCACRPVESQMKKSCTNRPTNHRTAPNLVLLKRLLELLEHCKVADIKANALAGRSKRAQGIAYINIDLPRVSLAGDDER